MKKQAFVAFAIAAFVVLGALSFAQAAEKQPIKIGTIFSVSGKRSALGLPPERAAILIVDEINQAGGVNGFPLELITRDDESLQSGAAGAAEKLIKDDRVLAILGPIMSGNCLAVKPICETAKVPNVACGAAEAITSPPESSRYIFQIAQHDSFVAFRILEQLKKMGINKIALLSETSPFGEEGVKQMHKVAKELGVEIVGEEIFTPSSSNMTPQLQKLAARGPGALVNWASTRVHTIVPKNMKAMGMNIPLFHTHGFGSPDYIMAVGEAGEGIMFPAGRLLVADELPNDHPQKKIMMDFKRSYDSRYHETANQFSAHGYDGIWLLANAIKAKNVTPDMPLQRARDLIRDGLEETKGWVGISGTFNMSATDHTGLDKEDSLEMLLVANGKAIPLSQKK